LVNIPEALYVNMKKTMSQRRPKHRKVVSNVFISAIFSVVIGAATFQACLFIHNQQIATDRNAKIQQAKKEADAKEAKRKEPVYIKLPGAKPIKALVGDYSKPDSIWTIVSKSHPISVDYVPSGLKIPDVATRPDKSKDEQSLRSDIGTPLKNMFDAASAAGHDLMIGSGYRSAALQKVYFDNLAATAGEAAANQAIAYPGQSEHQTGLALDISTLSKECYLDDCFATTADGLWLADNSYKYGFILRYPKGSESITEYEYEPWHFRYVGVDLATALHESNLTLDQAWPYLQKADATLHKNGAI
jgi:D-alanyl-D-alanine carboxypeptidase